MGRGLKRVPLDFDWPDEMPWKGYLSPYAYEQCRACQGHGCRYCDDTGAIWFSEEIRQRAENFYTQERYDPPSGPGYQLWETTSEGSPVSPVFATLDELCAWCEVNATTFATMRASAAEWYRMLNDGLVYHQEGGILFI